jgi:branched-chain amino acid transport system permease protein
MTSLLAQQTANGLVLACVYTLFALGLSVTWGVLKVLNLAHAHLFTVGALVAIFLSQETGLPVAAVAVLAALGAGAVAVVVDTVAFYPLRRRNLDTEGMEIASLITSLGASMILLSLASRWTGGTAQSFSPGFVTVENVSFLGIRVTDLQLVVAATAVLLTVAAWAVVQRTQFGRGLRAIAFSMDIARMVGVRAESSYRATLFVCGALAGVAGVLLALLLGSVDAFTGETLLIKGIAIIVLAGSGQILGLLVGGLLLGLGETVGSLWLPAPALASLPFMLIVVVLLLRPAGLFARVETVRA